MIKSVHYPGKSELYLLSFERLKESNKEKSPAAEKTGNLCYELPE